MNNPINYIDPDGRFLLDVHQRIARNALMGFNITFNKNFKFRNPVVARNISNRLNTEFYNGIRGNGMIVSGGVTYPDLYSQHDKSAHFDQMNFKQITNNFEKLNNSISILVNGKGTTSSLGKEIGKNLHALADFYTHSNYVELYESIYGQTNINSIPTFENALSNPDYSDFASLLQTSLKTGAYPGTGKGSHREMNHDVGAGSSYTNLLSETKGKGVNWNTKAAEDVATRASREYLNRVKSEIEKKK